MKIIVDNVEHEVNKLENGKWTLPLAYENGDETITCGALNIDGNRCGTETKTNSNGNRTMYGGNSLQESKTHNDITTVHNYGRYPAQTFCNDLTAEVLGETSKILHKCNYEDHDLYFYNPKVSKSERNAGCDGFEEQRKVGYGYKNKQDELSRTNEGMFKDRETTKKNTHPTLKPIALNEKILRLFKTPNEQKIVYPFAGSFSEVIGGYKAGFKNFTGCEINSEYVEIGNARFEYWKNKFDNEKEQMTLWEE
jgi:DNA modification methylase